MEHLDSDAEKDFLQKVIDAIPSSILVVDEDVKIQLINKHAGDVFALAIDHILDRRTGEVLHCIHTELSDKNCGRSGFCQHCVIRNSVILAMSDCKTHRQSVNMVLADAQRRRDLHLMISASPFHWKEKKFVILSIDNIDDLLQLPSLIPICMHCHDIRDEAGDWTPLADYLMHRVDVRFSHGICPTCLDHHYPGLVRKRS